MFSNYNKSTAAQIIIDTLKQKEEKSVTEVIIVIARQGTVGNASLKWDKYEQVQLFN